MKDHIKFRHAVHFGIALLLTLLTYRCHAQTPIQTIKTAIRMADDAAVPYQVFLVENSRKDCAESRVYYARCAVIRRPVVARVGEQQLLKFKQIVQ